MDLTALGTIIIALGGVILTLGTVISTRARQRSWTPAVTPELPGAPEREPRHAAAEPSTVWRGGLGAGRARLQSRS